MVDPLERRELDKLLDDVDYAYRSAGRVYDSLSSVKWYLEELRDQDDKKKENN